MQVVLLATGDTDKLRPLTEQIPSPMIPLLNRPVMSYAIELVARQGYKNILVCLHSLAGSIESYFGNGKRWGVNLQYVLLPKNYGPAGTLKQIEFHLPNRFLVLPADIIINFDIEQVLKQHQEEKNWVTALRGEEQPLPCAAHTGAYIFEFDALSFIPPHTKFDVECDLFIRLEANQKPAGYFQIAGYTNLLSSIPELHEAQVRLLQDPHSVNHKTLIQLNGYFSNGLLPGPAVYGQKMAEGIWVGKNNSIHPSVRLTPPIYIGDNNRIGREVELGPATVIGSNNVIDDEATISGSTILNDTYVGQLVYLNRKLVDKNLVVDLETEEYTRISETFLLGHIYQSLEYYDVNRLLDLIVLLCFLPLVIPLFCLLCLLVRIRNDHVFNIRTMHKSGKRHTPDVEMETFRLWNFHTKARNGDSGLLSKLLVKWQFYRLPELINVLKGEMSIIGVHPMTPEQVAELDEAWQKKALEYKPGFTGYWFVKAMPDSSLDELLVNDAYYVVTRNWKEDFRILWQTPVIWIRKAQVDSPKGVSGI